MFTAFFLKKADVNIYADSYLSEALLVYATLWVEKTNVLFNEGGGSRARAMDSSVEAGRALCSGIKSSALLPSDIATIPSSGAIVM